MSIKAVSWALEQPIGGNLKLVLIAIADSHSDGRGCFPSIETIIQKAHISKPTYKRVISQLEEKGLVTRQERFTETGRRTSNTFVLHFGVGGQVDTHVGDQSDTGEGITVIPGIGITADTHHTLNGNSNGYLTEESAPAPVLPDWLSPEVWQSWLAHLKAKRKTPTPITQAAQIRKLETYRTQGHQPENVIEHSIAGGYQGLYPENAKGKINGQSKRTPIERTMDAYLESHGVQQKPSGRVMDQDGRNVWPAVDE